MGRNELRDLEIIEQIKSGLSVVQVARIHNLSNQRISQIIKEQAGGGVVSLRGYMAHKDYHHISIKSVLALWDRGLSGTAIARHLGVAEGLIYYRLHQAGIHPKEETAHGRRSRRDLHVAGGDDRGGEPGIVHPHDAGDGGDPGPAPEGRDPSD